MNIVLRDPLLVITIISIHLQDFKIEYRRVSLRLYRYTQSRIDP